MSSLAVSRDALGLLVRQHTANVCRTMLALDVTPCDGVPPAGNAEGGTVVAFVGLTGPWNGSGSLSCSGNLARRLSSRMLLSDCPAVDVEVLDAFGEIANMIIGNVKEGIEHELGALAMSTPTVIYGLGLRTRSIDGETDARVVFACDDDILQVRVSLVPAQAAP